MASNIQRFMFVAFSLILGLTFVPGPAAYNHDTVPTLQKNKEEVKVKKGPEVAARVRQLKEKNKNVRAALKFFEDRKRTPKIDDSFEITGSASPRTVAFTGGGSVLRNVCLARQVGSDDGYVEILFVPTLSIENEWHGAAVGIHYDTYGNFIEQYVAIVVIAWAEPDEWWGVHYEAPVYGGEVQGPVYDSGLYEIAANTKAPQSKQGQLVKAGSGRVNEGRSYRGPHLVHASLSPKWLGKWGDWAKCTGAWCAGAAVGCAVAHLWDAEIGWGPCAAGGCIIAGVGCSYGTLWN